MHSLLSRGLAAVSLFIVSAAAYGQAADFDHKTIADWQAAFAKGESSSEALVNLYLKRIEAYDKKGPAVNSVILLNPQALVEAKALDAERKAGKVRGPLHGIPIVLKDNFDTFDMPTTAGSQLLAGSIPPDDAFVVKRLREAGAVIVAKVNLSEFASGGGSVAGATDPAILKAGNVPNGSSTQGGQTLNPHDLARGPAGSSGGTGVAIASAFAQFGLGTDTAGSVRGPAAANGIVGLKTTLGLVSRDGVVPLALSFDTVGPMARSVYDTAAALNVLAATDKDDAITQPADKLRTKDYTSALRKGSLRGVRIGVAREIFGKDPGTLAVMEASLKKLQELGAELVEADIPDYALRATRPLFVVIRNSEFKAQIADYLATLKPGFPRTMEDLVRLANDPATHYASPEKAFALKYSLQQALPLTDPEYVAAKTVGVAAMKSAMATTFAHAKVSVIVYPTATSPASLIKGEPAASGGASATTLVNESGYPELSVPAGMTPEGLPVNLSFLGQEYSEAKLLAYGFDFEQATAARVLPKHTPLLATP